MSSVSEWKREKEPVFLEWLNMFTVSTMDRVVFRYSVRLHSGGVGVTGPSVQKAARV